MNYMKLKDNTRFTIEDGASLANITHIAQSDSDAVDVCDSLTPNNLSHVEFCDENDNVYGVYNDLILNSPPTRFTNEDTTVTVTISLREKTDIERRLDLIEEEQEEQNETIDYLLMN